MEGNYNNDFFIDEKLNMNEYMFLCINPEKINIQKLPKTLKLIRWGKNDVVTWFRKLESNTYTHTEKRDGKKRENTKLKPALEVKMGTNKNNANKDTSSNSLDKILIFKHIMREECIIWYLQDNFLSENEV